MFQNTVNSWILESSRNKSRRVDGGFLRILIVYTCTCRPICVSVFVNISVTTQVKLQARGGITCRHIYASNQNLHKPAEATIIICATFLCYQYRTIRWYLRKHNKFNIYHIFKKQTRYKNNIVLSLKNFFRNSMRVFVLVALNDSLHCTRLTDYLYNCIALGKQLKCSKYG